MATKMLLQTSARRHILRLLNGVVRSTERKYPRCVLQCLLKSQQTTLTKPGICSRPFRTRLLSSNSTLGASLTDRQGIFLKGHSCTTTRGFCDAKNENSCDHDEPDFAEVQNDAFDNESEKPSEEIEILEEKKISGSSNTEPESAWTNNEVSRTTEAKLDTQDESQHVDNLERSEATLSSMHALTRTEFDELESDLVEESTKLDILAEQDSPTILEDFIQPLLPSQALSLADYADHSPTLQKLVKLGVDLSKVGKKAKIGTALMKLDFDRDIQDKIILLHHVGVKSGEGLGRFLTINPFVLTEDLASLETRLQYLRSKKFSESAITQILHRAPYFMSFSVERVDNKLGFFQRELSLTGNEIRHMITKMPKLVTFKVQRIKENIFVIHQQLGFTSQELKKLVLQEPKVLLAGKERLIGIFDYLHNHMNIPHKQLLKNPQVFNGRVFRLQERHQFLQHLGRAEYDPTQPGYISIEHLTKFPDHVFCQEIAKTSLEEYNHFLKTL